MKHIQTWIDKFTIAIVEKDFKTIDAMNADIPKELDIDQMKTIRALVAEAITLLEGERYKTKVQMKNLKNSKQFFSNQRQGRFSQSS